MTYPQAASFLNSFVNYERLNFYPYKSSFKLERVRRLLQFLGNPHQALRVIHIAGTKGKGSTCAFVANILKEAGFKIGLYTSPHLVDLRERIRILQSLVASRWSLGKQKISKKDFARIIEKIKPYAEKLRETKLGKLSYYEILTALAFLYFKEEETDFAVLETGIGGRLDATNVAGSFVCAITPISYEHTQVLGTTLKEIAAEKAAIIKNRIQKTVSPINCLPAPNIPRQAGATTKDVVCRSSAFAEDMFIGGRQKATDKRQIVITAPQRPTALKVIRRQTQKVGADLFEVGKDVQIKERFADINGQSFDVKGIFSEYPGLKIELLGRHQVINAAVAIGCVESLRHHGIEISQKAIRKGLKKTRWPARLQMISGRPRIVLDAAHNQASACALKDALTKIFKFRRLILVFGVFQDKDVKGILRELIPLASRIILTKTQNPRAMEPEIIKTFIKTNERPIVLTNNPTQALKIARQSASQKDLILVSGSLYLLGEVLKDKR